jgi:muconolactone delta-isomerase
MKFLILVKPHIGAPAPENPIAVYEAAKEYLNAMLADGTLDCVYQFVNGREAMSIGNADSHEEMWEKLTAYPLYPSQEYEVHALVDVNYAFDKSIERLQKMIGG